MLQVVCPWSVCIHKCIVRYRKSIYRNLPPPPRSEHVTAGLYHRTSNSNWYSDFRIGFVFTLHMSVARVYNLIERGLSKIHHRIRLDPFRGVRRVHHLAKPEYVYMYNTMRVWHVWVTDV